MISKLCLSLALLAAAATPAADRLPKAGSYGFNWLDPENTSCEQLTELDLANFSECTTSNNAFGLELESHACRVDDKVEFIVYNDMAQCQEAFETMKSNGD